MHCASWCLLSLKCSRDEVANLVATAHFGASCVKSGTYEERVEGAPRFVLLATSAMHQRQYVVCLWVVAKRPKRACEALRCKRRSV